MPKVATEVDVAAVIARLAHRPRADDADGRILDAAGALLVEGGIRDLEIEAVSARSGVGRSTIYRRFDGRNALIAAALAHELRRLLTALADAVSPMEDVESQVVAAFCAGIRLSRENGLSELARTEPLLLRLCTVDAGPVIAAATHQLVGMAEATGRPVDREAATAVAELLVRLAISFVLTPESALDVDDGFEETVRRHIAPLLRAV